QRFFRMSFAESNFFVRSICLRQRILVVVTDKRVNFSIHACDLIKAGLRDFARRNFALRQFSRQFGNGQLVQHLNPRFYSTIFGTMKSPFALAGALRNASSFDSDSRISSARVTLMSGTACAVGSTFDTSS